MKQLYVIFAFVSLLKFTSNAQECDKCKPHIDFFLSTVNLTKPGDKELEQKLDELNSLSHYLYEELVNNNRCVEIAHVGKEHKFDVHGTFGSRLQYIVQGSIQPRGENFELFLYLAPACGTTDQLLGESKVLFQLTEYLNLQQLAFQAVSELSPLIKKIQNFESRERARSKFPIGGAYIGGEIDVMVLNPDIKPGQQTGIILHMKDCDGKPVPNQEIAFKSVLAETLGGVVFPDKVKTDASGKARAVYKFNADAEEAYIFAHSAPVNVKGCSDVFFGYEILYPPPSYLISIKYNKQGSLNVRLKGADPTMSITIAESSMYSVEYAADIYHYASSGKAKDYVEIKADENDPLKYKSDAGSRTTLRTLVESSRKYNITKSPELVVNPLNAQYQMSRDSVEELNTSSASPPQVLMNFKNGTLEAFDFTVDFPLGDKATESGGFLAIRGEETSEIITNKIKDPKSPYKTEYLVNYYDKVSEGSPQGSTFITQVATVRILVK